MKGRGIMKMLKKNPKNDFKILIALLLTTVMLTGLMGCGQITQSDSDQIQKERTVEKIQGAESEATGDQAGKNTEQTVKEEKNTKERVPKQVITYFANWFLNSKEATHGGEVASIPWESVTFINHSFWYPTPADGTSETSFERRTNGDPARTEFTIASTNPDMDYEDNNPSSIDPSMERNHFAQYAVYSEKYPDVNIMIAFGGWTRSGYFSEMAYTPEGRASFIQSCMDLMDQYPWIDGIDIDWEHPGGSNDGERLPENDDDQGCPIWGTQKEDTANFAALCKEMREAFDAKYGVGVKKITACASASTGWTLPNQDWGVAEPYLDYINVMTYDMAGTWDSVTGHASGLNWVKSAVVYFMNRDIPATKLNIGAPLYGTGLKMAGQLIPGKIVGTPINKTVVINKENLLVDDLRAFETEAVSGYDIIIEGGIPVLGEEWDNSKGETVFGWHYGYDTGNQGAYLYNDDENSEFYKWYISYENPISLQAKLQFIEDYNLAGIIVWESSQDTEDHQMIKQMGDFLLQEK